MAIFGQKTPNLHLCPASKGLKRQWESVFCNNFKICLNGFEPPTSLKKIGYCQKQKKNERKKQPSHEGYGNTI
jgi:hypothetical protein